MCIRDSAWKESLYYFGDEDDGAMSLGWRQISIVDDEYEDLQPGDEYWDEDQDRWFYFQTSGKKVAADSEDGDTDVYKRQGDDYKITVDKNKVITKIVLED